MVMLDTHVTTTNVIIKHAMLNVRSSGAVPNRTDYTLVMLHGVTDPFLMIGLILTNCHQCHTNI